MKNKAANTQKPSREDRRIQKAEKARRIKADKDRQNAEKSERKALKQKLAAERKAQRAEQDAERRRLDEQRYAAKQKVREQNAARRKQIYAVIRKKLGNLPAGFDYGNFGTLPRVELKISGDSTSIASRLSGNGVAFTDMRQSGGFSFVKIRKKDLPKAIAILNGMCYNYQISATYGIWRRLAFMLSRCGLLLGITASVVCLYVSYGYVWRVDISGNDKLSVAAIQSVLDSAGYKSGCKKHGLDVMQAVAALGGMDGVADASCEVVGTTMYVRVLESEDYTSRVGYTAVCSAFDAKVTRIVVRSGSPLVKRGDVVKRGDTLASGDVVGTTGDVLYTEACDVDVYGDVSLSFTAEVNATSVEYVRTGKSSVKTVYSLFGHELGKARSPFDSYEMRAHTAHYDVLIPLYATTYEYYETTPVEITHEPDELAKSFANAKIEELAFVGEFECSYTVTEGVAGLYAVHLFLSGETLISKGV